MMKFKVSKDLSGAAIRKQVKAQLVSEFQEFLQAKYGEDKAGLVRIPSTNESGKNILAAIIGEVEEDETVYDLCLKVDISVPEWEDQYSSKSGKLWRSGFLFDVARKLYLKWVQEQEEKAAAKAERDAKKKAADAAARAKRKAEKGGGE